MTNPIVSKPDSGSEITNKQDEKFPIAEQYQIFLDDIEQALNFPTLPAFTVQDLITTVSPALTPLLPAPENQDVMVVVTDESAGRVPAISDGTNWRRIKDQAIIT